MKRIKAYSAYLALALAAQACCCGPLLAGVPLKINFQGRLDESGLPAEGSKTFVFKLYDAASGGTLLWTSQPQPLALSQGVFSAVLSAGAPAALSTAAFTGARYVEITVDGVQLSPRQEMVSAPYALVAQALAPDAELPASAIAAGAVTDYHVTLTTAAIGSGRFSDDRVLITTGAFFGGFNAADKLVKLDGSGRLGVGGAANSRLEVAGSVSLPIKTITFSSSPYTVTENDSTILVNATGGSVTVNLPSAAGITGRIYAFKRVDDPISGGFVSINASGVQTIDGASSWPLNSYRWEVVIIQSSGSAWMLLSY